MVWMKSKLNAKNFPQIFTQTLIGNYLKNTNSMENISPAGEGTKNNTIVQDQ